jgi:hypothetical protein
MKKKKASDQSEMSLQNLSVFNSMLILWKKKKASEYKSNEVTGCCYNVGGYK